MGRKIAWGLMTALACMLFAAGCGKEEADPSRIYEIYYVGSTETKVEVRDYEMQSSDTQDQIQEILWCLATMPSKLEYKAPLGMGFQLLDYRLDNDTLILNMDAAYKELSPSTEVLVRAALVCSLTQVENVDYVEITVDGNPLYDNLNNLVGRMDATQFVNNLGSEISSYEMADLTLYFANEAGDGLIAINRKKAYNTNIPLDRLVVEQLLAGPGQDVEGQVFPTVNPDTKIVSVRTRDGICYVNLDATFLNQIYNVTADVTIYSIVDSLVELNTINKVQISINGDTTETYREKYSFSTVFERNLDIVTTLD